MRAKEKNLVKHLCWLVTYIHMYVQSNMSYEKYMKVLAK